MSNILHLRDVYVGNHGIIYDQDGKMLSFKDKDGANNFLRSFLAYEKKGMLSLEKEESVIKDRIRDHNFIDVVDLPYIHMFHFYNIYVWGHLWDSVSKLEDFEGLAQDFRLATSRITPHINDIFLHFELLGYPKEKLCQFIWKGIPHRFQNLYVSNTFIPASSIRNIDWIQKKYIFNTPLVKNQIDELRNGKYKLFLSRTGLRKTINEDEIWSVLKNKGYIRLVGNEGLIQHIKYFVGAEKIICTHGAMERGMAFCLNKDVDIWEFYPIARLTSPPVYHPNDTMFQRDSRNIGIKNHFFIPSESDEEQNVTIDIELIKRIC